MTCRLQACNIHWSASTVMGRQHKKQIAMYIYENTTSSIDMIASSGWVVLALAGEKSVFGLHVGQRPEKSFLIGSNGILCSSMHVWLTILMVISQAPSNLSPNLTPFASS